MTETELIEAVEKATGPSRDLDRAILDACGIAVREFDPGDGDVSQWREWSDGTKVANTHITASIDAAFSLVERVLPGALRHMTECVSMDGTRYWRAGVMILDENPDAVVDDFTAKGATAPLAILVALLSAKASGP